MLDQRTAQARPTSKILVVDDNEANRCLAKETLDSEGYDVAVACGGVEALAAFERWHPDCVVLDVRMPDLDGPSVCARIRGLREGGETPILFLTALRDVDTFDRALEAGANDFLTKPVRPSELIVRVRSALEVRHLNLALREQYEVLRRQRDDLLRLQLQKERIMAFVVHDLKNPVNAIDLHAQLLLREKGIPSGVRSVATRIRESTKQLTRMIVTLLDVAKSDEGQLAPNPARVELRSLVGAVLAELAIAAEFRGAQLQNEVGAGAVQADEDLLRRTLENLVENAIRHAPAQTPVSVSSRSVDEWVELRIRDLGPGVPVAMHERVFDAFTQDDSHGPASTRTSRGLGLTFCKRAIEEMGGTIWVEDANPGAIFCARLPRA